MVIIIILYFIQCKAYKFFVSFFFAFSKIHSEWVLLVYIVYFTLFTIEQNFLPSATYQSLLWSLIYYPAILPALIKDFCYTMASTWVEFKITICFTFLLARISRINTASSPRMVVIKSKKTTFLMLMKQNFSIQNSKIPHFFKRKKIQWRDQL